MTQRSPLHFRGLVALAVSGVLLAAGGCDNSGSKRDSLYQQLTGTWRVQRIQLNAGTVILQDTVRIEFEQQDGRRRYRIIQTAQNDTTRKGRINIPRSNILSMTTGFPNSLVWGFDFEEPDETSTSVRLQLQSAWEGSARSVLGALGTGGGPQRELALDLERVTR